MDQCVRIIKTGDFVNEAKYSRVDQVKFVEDSL